ncbi:MAG: adenylyltransferase/cytidyltransferase family protein, partial [Candidatus Solibacter sp.]|nr:adenylyltransferase/cytidyltransferase family protein [Candidatus Solibacter sp.]
MQVYHSLAELPRDFGPSALSIGNFDGVHFGHRRILRRVKEIAKSTKPRLVISMMGAHPWCFRGMKDAINGNLRGLLL